MENALNSIRSFIQYTVIPFLKHPEEAELRVAQSDHEISFRLLLSTVDVPNVIGRNGYTASALRSLVQASAELHGTHASLKIISHDEEQERLQKIESDS